MTTNFQSFQMKLFCIFFPFLILIGCKSKQGLFLEKTSSKTLDFFYQDFLADPSIKTFDKIVEKPSIDEKGQPYYELFYGAREDGTWELEGEKEKVFARILVLSRKCGRVKGYKTTSRQYIKDGMTGTEAVFFETTVNWAKCTTKDLVAIGFSISDTNYPPRLNLYAYSPTILGDHRD